MSSNRAGIFITQGSGYKTFVPNPLPPDPPLIMDEELLFLLSVADRKLGRLDGITQILPNPDLFVGMYVKKEAVLSSQIEGTQASLADILVVGTEKMEGRPVGEVVNYVNAMNFGLGRLNEDEFPLSLRLIKEIHKVLMEGVRGSFRNPGEFRRTQNWIGPAGSSLLTAAFVPPAVPDMEKAIGDLEKYFYDESKLPALIKIALIHAQFETIHPFLDGNGRMGRLLITFWLCQQGILSKPLLYLSYFFKKNRTQYYDCLMNVRKNGAWEDWIKFFLQGIAETSDQAIETAKSIISLKNAMSEVLRGVPRRRDNYQLLVDDLFENPVTSRYEVAERLKITPQAAGVMIKQLCDLRILQDMDLKRQRNKKYAFGAYINILMKGTE